MVLIIGDSVVGRVKARDGSPLYKVGTDSRGFLIVKFRPFFVRRIPRHGLAGFALVSSPVPLSQDEFCHVAAALGAGQSVAEIIEGFPGLGPGREAGPQSVASAASAPR